LFFTSATCTVASHSLGVKVEGVAVILEEEDDVEVGVEVEVVE
jgi:hypothetical protein